MIELIYWFEWFDVWFDYFYKWQCGRNIGRMKLNSILFYKTIFLSNFQDHTSVPDEIKPKAPLQRNLTCTSLELGYCAEKCWGQRQAALWWRTLSARRWHKGRAVFGKNIMSLGTLHVPLLPVEQLLVEWDRWEDFLVFRCIHNTLSKASLFLLQLKVLYK